ncbi:Mu-like prophage protein-like protein [Solidesulfovibrio fructosivorans JJ]]|uniref:Mu-like prophage protein-like protein n=1 Tax=Solidesulfovibrio fructosivorans JJ] TaxID=596151 RepID=E1JRA8_SOLFR|nr:tape measure protein [Solidesulfovibrio fructosivorans]EFL53109.1 Mu-like prophage protein-like protein [Solidesulfovibrio fructosivorans JJ]]
MAGGSLDILIQAKDEASAVLESIQSRMSGLGSQGASSFSKIDSAASAVTTRLNGLYAAAVAVSAALTAGKFVQVPAQFESLAKQLETVTKSSKTAQEGMAWVQDFAQRTPYELSQVTDAFVKLTSYGFDPKQLLEPIGNAASGMQKELDQAVEAFADATRGEFERLKEFGLNASTVGNQVTFSWMENGQQMEKTVTKSAEKIGEALSGIWEGMFSGGMESQMSTFEGRLSNLMDAATRDIQQFMSAGLFESIKAKLAELTEALAELEKSGKLEEWGRIAAEQFDKIWEILKTVGKEAKDFISQWGKLLVALATVAAITKAAGALRQLTSILMKSKLGIAGLVLAAPELIDLTTSLAVKFDALYNPISKTNRLLKDAAYYQKRAAEQNQIAVDMLNQLIAAQGQSVSSMDEFRRKVAAGTIVLKDNAGQIGLTADQYKALSKEIKDAGTAGYAYLSQVADRYDMAGKEAKALATTEGAAAAAGLAAQKDKYEAVLAVAKSVAAAQEKLVNESAANETQKAALRKQVEQDLMKAKKDALTDWLSALKSGLDEALAQEKRYAEESREAGKTTEEKLRDLKRQTMTQSAAYYDELKVAAEKLAQAEQEASKGTAEGYDNAMKLAKEAQNAYAASASSGKDVVGQAQAVQTAMKGVADAGQVWKDAADKGKDAWAEAAKSMKDQIAEVKAELADMQKSPLSLKVDVDTEAVDKALDALNGKKTESEHTVEPDTTAAQKAIAELEKDTYSTHYVYEKKVEAYATGGPARSVPAMVMPGEVVIDKDAARENAPLLHAINSMRLAREAVAHFAAGGGVFRPFRRGLVPGVGNEDSEPVMLDEGAFVVRKAAVAKYGRGVLDAIQSGRMAGVQAFATGGFVWPDWMRKIQAATAAAPETPTPMTPQRPTPLSVAVSVPAAFRGATTPLAAAPGMSAHGAAAVSRLDGIRHAAAVSFAKGGNLDEQLADIALERKRTREDYDEAVSDAKGDHDDQLADLLTQEQADLDDIAQTLADTLADLQAAWEEAQAAYQEAIEEAQAESDEALADAQSDYQDAMDDARSEYEEQKQELQDAVDEAYAAWQEKKKEDKIEHGYTKTTIGANTMGGKPTTHYWVSDQDALDDWEAEVEELKQAYVSALRDQNALGGFRIPTDAVATLGEAKAEAKTTLDEATGQALADLGDAQNTFTAGTDEAKAQAADDTQATKDQAEADKADLAADLADTLDDLKKDFDRAMEDLDIEEARARADADEEKGYSISGFSQWLSSGGPVAVLDRIRKYAAGGWAALSEKLPRFADGGEVPMLPGAVAGQDSVLARVMPGEGMVNVQAMRSILSKRALDALNSLDLEGFLGALPRFADGGVVPGGSLAAAAAAVPDGASSGSGYTATLNLSLGGKTFETRATEATAMALARQLRRLGGSMK